jgi:hypothetical protein
METKKPRPKQYEKNLPLHPLKFRDAVSALLKVKPQSKKKISK